MSSLPASWHPEISNRLRNGVIAVGVAGVQSGVCMPVEAVHNWGPATPVFQGQRAAGVPAGQKQHSFRGVSVSSLLTPSMRVCKHPQLGGPGCATGQAGPLQQSSCSASRQPPMCHCIAILSPFWGRFEKYPQGCWQQCVVLPMWTSSWCV